MKILGSTGKQTVNVEFISARGETMGNQLIDVFYLSEKALSRFEVLVHRSGVEVEIKQVADITPEVLKAMHGQKVWARVTRDDRDARLKTDGWNFRPETDPPEDELFVDYKAQDEYERMLDGL